MRKLRIATMVSGQYTTPQPPDVIYAPMDIAIDVAEGLEAKGHEVTLFAAEGSKGAKVSRVETGGLPPLKGVDGKSELPITKSPGVRGAELSKIYGLWDQYLLSLMYQEALEGKFDVLHVHPVDRALPLALAARAVPTAYTLHDPIFAWRAELFRRFQSPNQWYVSISDAQRKPAPDLNYAGTVYNGMRLEGVPVSEKPGDYLVFVGRLNPDKGVAEAIEVAKRAGERLMLLGPPTSGEYWETRIKPHIDGEQIVHVGVVDRAKLYDYYKNAKAHLFPIQWEEPFGLVMIEAMATGTPVLALRRGSVPEVVAHGKTGFVLDTVDEMVDAVQDVAKIDRKACRAHVEKNFGVGQMVEGYEQVFARIAK